MQKQNKNKNFIYNLKKKYENIEIKTYIVVAKAMQSYL